tara:strand:+ start:679 stop:4689 length:4011 start_codon:yes stop_codon:yes gene_type:complete
MPQNTDLNVAPYFDDFNENDNFHRVLFRPGFAVQARELTTLQSILQNQIERHGNHVFKEGSVVIPGQISYVDSYNSVSLQNTFNGEDVDPSQFYNATDPVTITGATTGVKAYVVGYQDATSTTPPILFINYYQTGTDNATAVFGNGENISADTPITHTTGYAIGAVSATSAATSASNTGSAVEINEGIYFVRGSFVRVAEQTLVLSTNSTTESARVGLVVSEDLVTPEEDPSLTDNARGSSNYAAKGAHRLKFTLTLSKLDEESADDGLFIELINIRNGVIQSEARNTDYSVLGDTLARRTFDESGDYTVRPFTFEVKESINNSVGGTDFSGVYGSGATTDDGNTADESLLSVACSTGKAYVRGYEIEKISTTFKDITKARDFNTVSGGITNLDFGNFVKIDNLYNIPDISDISGETTPFKEVKIYDTATSSRGDPSGNQIGTTRIRAIQYLSGTSGNVAAIYRAYLFDTRMFTKLTMSGTPSPTIVANESTGGQKVTGVTSGATGFVYGSLTTGTAIFLTNVTGAFSSGENITVHDSGETDSIVEDSGNTDLTISSVETFKFSDSRSFFMDDAAAGQDFTADLVLESVTSNDVIKIDATDANGTDAEDNILLEEDGSTIVGIEPIKTPQIYKPDQNVALFDLPKDTTKTLLTTANNGASDTQYTVRRQFVGTSSSSGAVSFSAGTNEVFASHTEGDYVMSILTAGDGSGSQGDLVPISGKIAGTGTASITITDDTILGENAKVKLVATTIKSNVSAAIKTTNLCKRLKVAADTDAFGTKPTDSVISLGRADAYQLLAVFDSEDTSSDATSPSMTLSSVSGTFDRGERITGATSGAIARCITATSPMSYVILGGLGSADFTAGETVTGSNSGATATVGTVTAGSKLITGNYNLDTGQRDNYYDISRITKNPGAADPTGRLLVVYDYFSHGTGDFFSVDSYTSQSGQMNYDDIPAYNNSLVPPQTIQTFGNYILRNSLDFRPTVANISGTSETVTSIDQVNAESFDFVHRAFTGAGAVSINIPKPNSTCSNDFEFYLSKVANLYLTVDGDFKIIEGKSAENPKEPKDLDNALKLARFFIPAFTFTPDSVQSKRYKTQRFTMKDIGLLQDRIENVEYFTALSLLERNAESFEIIDANGLNRFKSGFIVDNFSGHRVGDVLHPDYNVSIDMIDNELRPIGDGRNATLIESVTTDSERSGAGYQKTGDLITLPYTEEVFVEQPYATRVENVQPFMTSNWVGKIEFKPSSDTWFETKRGPQIIVNNEGNFDSVVASANIGTVWNSWETVWSGVSKTEVENTPAYRYSRPIGPPPPPVANKKQTGDKFRFFLVDKNGDIING